MSEQTDTPRTDEVAWPETGLVEGDFARQLERELTAVTEQRDRLAEALTKIARGEPNWADCVVLAREALQSIN